MNLLLPGFAARNKAIAIFYQIIQSSRDDSAYSLPALFKHWKGECDFKALQKRAEVPTQPTRKTSLSLLDAANDDNLECGWAPPTELTIFGVRKASQDSSAPSGSRKVSMDSSSGHGSAVVHPERHASGDKVTSTEGAGTGAGDAFTQGRFEKVSRCQVYRHDTYRQMPLQVKKKEYREDEAHDINDLNNILQATETVCLS